jgi:cobalt-zinc-cadmium efflux system outer membrane protein
MRAILFASTLLLLTFPGQVSAESPETSEKMTIEKAVAEDREHNLELMAERGRLPIAEARLLTAGLRPNPTLSFTADHLDLLGTHFSETNGAGPGELAVGTEFTWELAGKRHHRLTVAAKERTIDEWEINDFLRRLTFEVQSAFLDVMVAQENLKVSQENQAQMARIAEINAARVAAGDLSEVESMRSLVAVRQLENFVNQAELELKNARNRLHLLMGRTDSESYPQIVGDFRNDPHLIPAEEVRRLALAQRPDLRAASVEEERAAADVLLQKANRRADLTLGAEYRRQQGINGAGNSLGVSVSVPLPFFNRNQGELARAHGERNRATLRTAALRASILAEVRTALDQLDSARRQLERIESNMLKQVREVRDVTQYAYQRGEADFLE